MKRRNSFVAWWGFTPTRENASRTACSSNRGFGFRTRFGAILECCAGNEVLERVWTSKTFQTTRFPKITDCGAGKDCSATQQDIIVLTIIPQIPGGPDVQQVLTLPNHTTMKRSSSTKDGISHKRRRINTHENETDPYDSDATTVDCVSEDENDKPPVESGPASAGGGSSAPTKYIDPRIRLVRVKALTPEKNVWSTSLSDIFTKGPLASMLVLNYMVRPLLATLHPCRSYKLMNKCRCR